MYIHSLSFGIAQSPLNVEQECCSGWILRKGMILQIFRVFYSMLKTVLYIVKDNLDS